MVAANEAHDATPYLLPTAPEALVKAVRKHLGKAALRDFTPHRWPDGRIANGVGQLAHRSPWQLLHVDSSAPQSVLDIAYRIWQETGATAASPFVPIEPPAARAEDPAPARREHPPLATQASAPAIRNVRPRAAAQPAEHANVNGRLAGLGVALATLSAPAEAAPATPAIIESLSGSRRFGVGAQPLRMGTDPGCDVEITGRDRVEARIWPHGTGYMLRVVAGQVLVNGVPADCVVLDDGDILEAGDAAFRFRRQTH